MFQIGDLVEYVAFGNHHNEKLIGFVEDTSDGEIGVRWLTTKFGYCAGYLSIFTNPLDYLRKIDKIDEEVP
jgi:hypothetical protein